MFVRHSCICLLILTVSIYGSNFSEDLDALKKGLRDLDSIPLQSSKEPLIINMFFRLSRIITIDIGTGDFAFAGIAMMKWNDYRIPEKWNKSFTEVTHVRLSCDDAWCPDLRMYNTIGEISDESEMTSNIIVYPDGNMTLSEPRLYSLACYLDAYLFPFDTQKCNLRFGTWTYMKNEVQFLAHSLPNVRPTSNGWIVEEVTGIEEEVDILLYPQSQLVYTITMHRQWKPYFLNIVAPTVLISILSLLIFFLPVQSGEKVDFGVTIFLTLCVNSLVIAEAVPASSERVPLITWVNSVVTGMVAGSLLAAIVTTRFLQSSAKTPPIPKYLHMVLYYVGFVFCIGFTKWNKRKHTTVSLEDVSSSESELEMVKRPLNENAMEAILEEVRALRGIIEGNQDSSANFDEWLKVAEMIDKIFAIAFITVFAYVTYVFVSLLEDSVLFV